MNQVSNPRVLMNKYSDSGYPIPGETVIYDESQQIDLNAPLEGGILIKILYLSIDPYQRGRMRSPRSGSGARYVAPYDLGKPVSNDGIGVVLRSENPQAKPGDHVYGFFDYQAYLIRKDLTGLHVLPNNENLPWSVYVGMAGMPGQTAYIGWKLFSHAKKGETVFVSTAAGSVGSAVVQIAKSHGLKVIASAGSDDKVAFAKSIGADVAFNYKVENTRTVLESLGHGIDIYWDNVGGEMLEIAIDALNNNGRVINCGCISSYNSAPYPVKNLGNIVGKRLKLCGFIVRDHPDLYDEFYAVFPPKIAKGEIKYKEHIYHGLQSAGQGILDVQTGHNMAKADIKVAEA